MATKTGWDDKAILTNNLAIWTPGGGNTTGDGGSVASDSVASSTATPTVANTSTAKTPEKIKPTTTTTKGSSPTSVTMVPNSTSYDSQESSGARSNSGGGIVSQTSRDSREDDEDDDEEDNDPNSNKEPLTLEEEILVSVQKLDHAFHGTSGNGSGQDLQRQYKYLVQVRTMLQKMIGVGGGGGVQPQPQQGSSGSGSEQQQQQHYYIPCATLMVEMMKKNPQNLKVMEEGTCILYLISKVDPSFKKGVARLFKAMDDHPYQLSIQRAATAAIRNVVAANVEALTRISPSIRVILESMNRFPDDAKLLHTGLELLDFMALSTSPKNGGTTQIKSFFVTSGAMSSVITALTKQFTHVSIQSTALLVLSHLSLDDCSVSGTTTTSTTTSSGGNGNNNGGEAATTADGDSILFHELRNTVPHILKSMNHHKIHPKVQRHGCSILRNMSSAAPTSMVLETNDKNSFNDKNPFNDKNDQPQPATMSEIVSTLLRAMQLHLEDALIQDYGCEALGHLLSICDISILHDFVSSDESSSSRQQQQGLHGLQSFRGPSSPPRGGGNGTNGGSTSVITGVGGMGTILLGMSRHPMNILLQQHGLEVLSRICIRDKEYYGYFVSEKGLDILLTILGTNLPNEIEIVQLGCELLKHITRQSLDFQRAVTAKGGIPILFHIMQKHVSRIDIEDPAFACVRNLCTHPDNRLQVAIDGGISTLLVTMFVYVSDAAIQAYGCDALGRLALEPENRIAIVEEHGIDAAIQAMLEHRGHAGVQDRAVFLLLGLSEYEPAISIMKKSAIGSTMLLRDTKVPSKPEAISRLDQLIQRVGVVIVPPTSTSTSSSATSSKTTTTTTASGGALGGIVSGSGWGSFLGRK